MKHLKPTLRERNRYVAFELSCGRKCGRDEVVKAVWKTLLRFLGEIRVGKLGLWVMDWLEGPQKGILKVSHKSIRDVRLGLAMLDSVGDSRAAVNVLGVSGTLKKAREKYLGLKDGQKETKARE